MPRKTPLADRFWSKVQKQESGCWIWTGTRTRDGGYGQIRLPGLYAPLIGPMRLAHRVAYELLVGPIPAGLVLDHLCRNRRCVNPAHLEPVTQRVNIQRGETGHWRRHLRGAIPLCLVAAVLLAGGCVSGSFDKRANQDVVTWVVWHDLFGMDREPPPVEWIPLETWGNSCSGMALPGWKVQVSCGDGCVDPVEETPIAHELMHMRTFDQTGDVDVFHRRGDWALADAAALEAAKVIWSGQGRL